MTKKQKQHPSPGDDASTAEAASGRVGRDEQGEARRANITPNDGSHLELGRLRFKTWSKSDFSIAEMTWPTCLSTYIYKWGSPRWASARLGSAHARKYQGCSIDTSRP